MGNFDEAIKPPPHRCLKCGYENTPKMKPMVEITPSGAGYCASCGHYFTVPVCDPRRSDA